MKFAIILLVVIAVASLLSMFVVEFYPMRAGFPGWEDFYKDRYGMGDGVFAIFNYLHLYDPYRSWWYQCLLGVLGLSLFACLVDRIPSSIRQAFTPQYRLKIGDLSIFPQYQHWTGVFNEAAFVRSLKQRFRIRVRDLESGKSYYGSRGWFNLFGPIGMHLGLLVLVLGGLWIGLWGTSESISGFPGDVIEIPEGNFEVRIDDFRIEYYPLNVGQIVLISGGPKLGRIKAKLPDNRFVVDRMNEFGNWEVDTLQAAQLANQFDLKIDRGNIKDYLCDLTIIENDQPVTSFTAEVNHPLRYSRYRFYQSSYDPDDIRIISSYDSLALRVMRNSDGTALDTIWLQPDQKAVLPLTSLMVSVSDFQPDFRIGENGATSASDRMDNPAVQIEYFEGDSLRFHQWSFLKKEFHQSSANLPVSVQFTDIQNPRARKSVRTILQMRYTPGTELIWAGFIIATLGLMLAFYTGFRRVWALVLFKDNVSADLYLAMSSRRGSSEWEQRFRQLVEELKSVST